MKKLSKLLVLSLTCLLASCVSNGGKSNPAPGGGGGSNENEPGGGGGGSNEPATASEAAQMIRELDLNIDPAKYILGIEEEAPSAKPHLAISGEEDPSLLDIARKVDNKGTEFKEEEDYGSWTKFQNIEGDIAERIIGQCKGFADTLESFQMFKDYIPDDLTYGQAKDVTITLSEGGYTMDFPMSFYLNNENNVITFFIKVDIPGMVQMIQGFEIESLANGQKRYTVRGYNLNEHYEYMPLRIEEKINRYSQSMMYWDNNSNKYFYYNYDVSHDPSFRIKLGSTHHAMNLAVDPASSSYIELDNGYVRCKNAEAVDIYAVDNDNGTVTVSAEPHKAENNNPNGGGWSGNHVRYVPVDSCSYSSWVDGEYYEYLHLNDVPDYARSNNGDSLFKAIKDSDGHWNVFRTIGYGSNECFAVQDDNGWYMAYDYSREENGDVGIYSLKVASQDAFDICLVDLTGRSCRLTLNSFEGFDEIRAPKEEIRLASNATYNGRNIDTYYTTSAPVNSALYKNGVEVLKSHNTFYGSYVDSEISENVYVAAGFSVKGARENEINKQQYLAGLDLVSREGQQDFTNEKVVAYLQEKGISLKQSCNNGNLRSYLDKAYEVGNSPTTYLARFNFYHLSDIQTYEEYCEKVRTVAYPAIECKAKVEQYFAK